MSRFLLCLIIFTFPILLQAQNEQKITPPDLVINKAFGNAIALVGNYLIVGASDDNSFQGSAYVYEFDGTNWVFKQKIVAGDGAAGDRFGCSVAIHGTSMVIGAYGHKNFTGAVYVYNLSGTVWTQNQKLYASDSTAFDRFGERIAIYDNHLVAGAQLNEINNKSSAGAAYIFTFNGSTWVEIQQLIPTDTNMNRLFGASVSIYQNVIAIGSTGNHGMQFAGRGAAYIFRFNDTIWVQEKKILVADPNTDQLLGIAISTTGNRVAIGAYHDNDNGIESGAVYVYKYTGTDWVVDLKVKPSDGEAYETFGADVRMVGSRLLIGVPNDDDSGSQSGSAYLYLFDGTTWNLKSKFTGSDIIGLDGFGGAVALTNHQMAVGATGRDGSGYLNLGAAYLYYCTPPVLTTTHTNESSSGAGDGTATAIASGGTPPYTYIWHTPVVQTTQTATGLSSGVYRLDVLDADGCQSQDSVTIVPMTGLDALDLSDRILLFPNPAHDQVTLRMQGLLNQEMDLMMFDQTGRMVMIHRNILIEDGFRIDCAQLVPGFYRLKLQNEKFSAGENLVIIR